MTDYPRDDSGQIQVDFVWGNFPMQPDEDRGEDTLDPELDNHTIAINGWSNYPQYIPNYDGLTQWNNLNQIINDDNQNDGEPDADLEVVVPNVVGLSWNDSVSALQNVGLAATGSFKDIEVNSVTSSGKTVTLNVTDSFGVKKGQTIWVDVTDDADPAVTTSWNEVVVTSSTATTIKFAVETAPSPALNITVTSSSVYGDSTTLSQDAAAGEVVNSGSTITLGNIWD
jgi:hypothetical protein